MWRRQHPHATSLPRRPLAGPPPRGGVSGAARGGADGGGAGAAGPRARQVGPAPSEVAGRGLPDRWGRLRSDPTACRVVSPKTRDEGRARRRQGAQSRAEAGPSPRNRRLYNSKERARWHHAPRAPGASEVSGRWTLCGTERAQSRWEEAAVRGRRERPVWDPAWSATRTRSGASRPKTTLFRPPEAKREPWGASGSRRERPRVRGGAGRDSHCEITQTPARNGDVLRHLGRDRNL